MRLSFSFRSRKSGWQTSRKRQFVLVAHWGPTQRQPSNPFVTGVGRQSKLMLDNIGVIVKAEEAYTAYAAKLGLAADELTDVQKKLAFAEAAFEAIDISAEGLSEGTKTLSDHWFVLKNNITNAADAMIDFVNKIPSNFAIGPQGIMFTGAGMAADEAEDLRLRRDRAKVAAPC